MKSTQKGHSGLSHQSTASSSSSSSSSSELLAVIVTISAVSFVFYFPFAFTWSVLTGLGSVLSSDWSSLLQLLRRFFLECSEIVHSLNLFVYLYHVRAFRREFARMFGCTANACRRVSLQTSTKDATMASTTKWVLKVWGENLSNKEELINTKAVLLSVLQIQVCLNLLQFSYNFKQYCIHDKVKILSSICRSIYEYNSLTLIYLLNKRWNRTFDNLWIIFILNSRDLIKIITW